MGPGLVKALPEQNLGVSASLREAQIRVGKLNRDKTCQWIEPADWLEIQRHRQLIIEHGARPKARALNSSNQFSGFCVRLRWQGRESYLGIALGEEVTTPLILKKDDGLAGHVEG